MFLRFSLIDLVGSFVSLSNTVLHFLEIEFSVLYVILTCRHMLRVSDQSCLDSFKLWFDIFESIFGNYLTFVGKFMWQDVILNSILSTSHTL